jgi:hypothetical protein
MIQTALYATAVVFIGLAFLLMKELVFLAPVKDYVWEHYGQKIMVFSGALALNLFCLFYGVIRWTRLQDTGDKLKHLEKQLRGKETISEELSSRILERK